MWFVADGQWHLHPNHAAVGSGITVPWAPAQSLWSGSSGEGPAIGALLVGTTADWIGLEWPLTALTGLVLWRMQAQGS